MLESARSVLDSLVGLLQTPDNHGLRNTYDRTSGWYDSLDRFWEDTYYRHWRPMFVEDLEGDVLELGVGTGQNLPYYPDSVESITGVDLSPKMLEVAKSRLGDSEKVDLIVGDACNMPHKDAIVASFLCCVMPDHLQPSALEEMNRVLKVGGRFRLVEILESKSWSIWLRQQIFKPWVKYWFGATFDKQTTRWVKENKNLKITNVSYLKDDTHILIEGVKIH